MSELLIGQSVRLRDIADGAKWTPVSDPDTMLVHVVAPRAEEPAPAEGRARRRPSPRSSRRARPEKEDGK